MTSLSSIQLRMKEKNASPDKSLAWKREFKTMTCGILRYAPWVYRDEIKEIEYMLVYFHFPFAPFHIMVGFKVYGIFENEPREL